MALYNKYRPFTLDMVCGQEHIRKILANQVKKNEVSHTNLFTGPAGTGKTTVARILAAMVNATGGPTVAISMDDPIVNSIMSGRSSMDVMEIDAASNRGIDDTKELRRHVPNAPMEMRMKVFIIDECHQLTSEAWNCLLKLLEEPPKHAIFVLCTTEKRKVLETIQSRSVLFEFRALGLEDVAKQVRYIANAEKIDIEDEAIRMVAGSARGSLRTAISKLEKLANLDERVTAKLASNILGTTSRQTIGAFIEAVIDSKLMDALAASSDALSVGLPPEDFFAYVSEFCHDIAFFGATGYDYERLGYSKEENDQVLRIRDKMAALVGKTNFRHMLLKWIEKLDFYSKVVVYKFKPQFLVNFAYTELYYVFKSYKDKAGTPAA